MISAPTIWLRTILTKNGLQPTDDHLAKLEDFVGMLLEWNAKINLISRKDTEHIWQAHILHSASILIQHRFPQEAKILDLGSGGGLPGVVIKLLRPDLSVTCLDATKKKVDAIADMIGRLGLTDCSTAWGRAEDLGKTAPLSGSFEFVVARAVAPLRDLARWSRPFFRRAPRTSDQSPTLVTLKGGDLEKECAQTKALPWVRCVNSSSLSFPGSEAIPGVDKKIVIVEFE